MDWGVLHVQRSECLRKMTSIHRQQTRRDMKNLASLCHVTRRSCSDILRAHH